MTTVRRRAKRRKNISKVERRSFFVMTIGILAAAVFFSLALALFALGNIWLANLPDYSDMSKYTRSGITTVYAADEKTVLAKIYKTNRIEVSFDEISDYVKNAVVATEDSRFMEHDGIDGYGIVRAVVANASGGDEGASTITQQLVRNTVLLDEMTDKTYERKIREMYIAIELEKKYSKDELLSMYLNVVNFGDGCYGIEAASMNYFGKHASKLDLAESALLAGIPNSPSMYGLRTNYKNALERREHVLDRMEANGYITAEQHAEASKKKPKVVSKKKRKDKVRDIAPYFIDYVKELVGDNPKKFGIDDIMSGGYNIYTSIVPENQDAANAAVENAMVGRGKFDASLVSIDPTNGHIVALVGGKDYSSYPYNLATQMSRQAGSSFKPFTLIAALNNGISPYTKIDSTSPAAITPTWTVRNSEGDGSGYMTLKSATTNSVNTVYARVAHEIGAKTIVDTAHDMGIRSELQEVESISLGTQGVNTLEMASAYATLASGGVYHEPVAIIRIENDKGSLVYEDDSEEKRVLSKKIASETTKILSTVVESGTGTAAKLYSGQQAAGKTGTSEHGRDLWFCGYTPQYATAVWSGYRQEAPTYSYGGTVSAPIWRSYMDKVIKKVEDFPNVDTSDVKYDYFSGTDPHDVPEHWIVDYGGGAYVPYAMKDDDGSLSDPSVSEAAEKAMEEMSEYDGVDLDLSDLDDYDLENMKKTFDDMEDSLSNQKNARR